MPVLFDRLAERFIVKRAGRIDMILDAAKRLAGKAVGHEVDIPVSLGDVVRRLSPEEAVPAPVPTPVPAAAPAAPLAALVTPATSATPTPKNIEAAKEKVQEAVRKPPPAT